MADDERSEVSPEVRITAGPTPTDEEVAAIAAAVQVVLASTGGRGQVVPDDAPPRWRFSGRWWSKPVPTRRDRPSLF